LAGQRVSSRHDVPIRYGIRVNVEASEKIRACASDTYGGPLKSLDLGFEPSGVLDERDPPVELFARGLRTADELKTDRRTGASTPRPPKAVERRS
jgi:hypothetical protein